MASKQENKLKNKDYIDAITSKVISAIGLSEAERDQDLASYYIGEDNYLNRALDFNDPAYLFIGPKGVGKSAILQMVRLKNSHNQHKLIDITPEDLSFQALANIEQTTILLEQNQTNQHLFRSLWDYVLCVEIARREHKMKSSLQRFLETLVQSYDAKLIRRLAECTFDDSGNATPLATRIIGLLQEIELSFESNGVIGKLKINPSKKTERENSSKNIQVLSLINAITKSISNNDVLSHQYYILIDDLDIYWTGSEIQKSFISALIHSLKRLSKSQSIKPLVSLRDYIYYSIPLTDKDKMWDSVCDVYWSEKDIKQMVQSRIKYFTNIPDTQIWANFFPTQAFARMFKHTKGTPREILRLSAMAIEQSKKQGELSVSSQSLNNALASFSNQRISDLGSLQIHDYPGIDKVVKYFSGQQPEINLDTIQDIIILLVDQVEKKTDDGGRFMWVQGYFEDPIGFSEILLKIGFLLFKDGRKSSPREFTPESDRVTTMSWFAIHPMYSPALGMGV